LVILDVTMPVLNGFRAAKKINELMPKGPHFDAIDARWGRDGADFALGGRTGLRD
jgi:CheY-like chemotaxis protein